MKEKKKKNPTSRTRLLGDGLPRLLTADEFVQAVGDAEAAAKEREDKKKARAKQQVDKRAAVAALNAQWQEMKAEWEAGVARWQADCIVLAQDGVPRRLWPKKPSRPKKPKLDAQVETEAVGNIEEGSESETSAEEED